MTQNHDPIASISSRHPWRVLTDDQLNQLVDATLEVLEETGVQFPLRSALELFSDHGADVDFDAQVVRIPPELVSRALATAPRYFRLAGRDPRYDVQLRENHTFFSTDGCFPHAIDFDTGQRRRALKADVVRSARIADELEAVAFYWPMASASDYGRSAPLHELHAAFANCRKHVQTESVMGETSARYALEMAKVISGNPGTLRQRPPLSALVCCIDPLGQDREGLETALVLAQAGLPVGFMAMPTMMSTGPATPAGSLVVGNAAVISGITLIQLAYPGAPVFHSMPVATMDPRTADYLMHTPLADPLFGAAMELAHAQGLPCLGNGFGTDAHEPGWQSAKEHGRSCLLSALLGSEMVVGLGGMASVTTLRLENLILDADLFFSDRVAARGLEVNDETLALDVIEEVGPRGHYLTAEHTLRHMREIPLSDLVLETRREGRTDARGPVAVARARVQQILEQPGPQPLSPHVQAELDDIVASADREMNSIA